MSNLEILEECLKRNWFFARRVWDDGPEWFIEAWNPEAEEWVEANGKRLTSVFNEVKAMYEECDS